MVMFEDMAAANQHGEVRTCVQTWMQVCGLRGWYMNTYLYMDLADF